MNWTVPGIISILILLSSPFSYGQEAPAENTSVRKNAISFNILGVTPLVGITYERVLSKKLSIELGVGFPSIGGGIKFFPWNMGTNKLLFYTGFMDSHEPFEDFSLIVDYPNIAYIPFGISYFGKHGIHWGLDVGPAIALIPAEADGYLIPYGNFKVGYRFPKTDKQGSNEADKPVQETPDEDAKLRKNAISLNILGATPLIGITYERVVSNKISIEFGLGLPSVSVGTGFKVFPNNIKMKKLMFHTGLINTFFALEPFGIFVGYYDIVYVPIGISYFGRYGFNFGLDLGPGLFIDPVDEFVLLGGNGNLKLGFRF